jgi:acyl-coenzyme A thioesterase PaaI-like protein
MASTSNKVLGMYRRALRWPLGRQLFSAYAARKAPYFATISPLINTLEPNHCEILLRKRKRVQNHIGTVHVIAIANGLEMAMGFLAEASIPKHLRWIPKGMELSYPAKAPTDIRCTARVAADGWKPGDLPVQVEALDADGNTVVAGTIHLWISEKPPR